MSKKLLEDCLKRKPELFAEEDAGTIEELRRPMPVAGEDNFMAVVEEEVAEVPEMAQPVRANRICRIRVLVALILLATVATLVSVILLILR